MSVTGSPLELVRKFMKLMEPLNYDAALKLVSDTCEYTNPPPIGTVHGPGRFAPSLSPSLGRPWRMSFVSSAAPPQGRSC